MFNINILEENNFFQEDNKDMRIQKELNDDRIIDPFVFDNFDWEYNNKEQNWNSLPNISPDLSSITGASPLNRRSNGNVDCNFTLEANKNNKENKEVNDNTSNIANTEEDASCKVGDFKKCANTNETSKELDTEDHSHDSIKFNQKDVDELLTMINRPSTDMNRLLSEVLTAGPTDPTVKRKRAITKEVKGKRMRKSKEQIEALTREYEANPNWDNEEIANIAMKLGLKKKQVYKWFWDQKKKSGELKARNW